jgi:predicted enzyme related to lactoylglutathione lyase
MPTRDSAWPNGTPCWVDLGIPDIEAAKAFYAPVLGWTFSGGGPDVGGYTNCEVGGLQAAGLGPLMAPDEQPRWTTYFATDDADGTAEAVTAAGGTLLFPPMDVLRFGRMCLARDPQGNRFGLWQANEHIGVQVFNEPGGLVWNDAAVDDQAAGQAFYTAVFGFRFDEIEGMGGYATFTTEERPLGGFGVARPCAPTGWNTCFSVASADDAVAAVEAGGGKVTMAAEDSPYGRIAGFEDPWGAHFAVMQGLEA